MRELDDTNFDLVRARTWAAGAEYGLVAPTLVFEIRSINIGETVSVTTFLDAAVPGRDALTAAIGLLLWGSNAMIII